MPRRAKPCSTSSSPSAEMSCIRRRPGTARGIRVFPERLSGMNLARFQRRSRPHFVARCSPRQTLSTFIQRAGGDFLSRLAQDHHRASVVTGIVMRDESQIAPVRGESEVVYGCGAIEHLADGVLHLAHLIGGHIAHDSEGGAVRHEISRFDIFDFRLRSTIVVGGPGKCAGR